MRGKREMRKFVYLPEDLIKKLEKLVLSLDYPMENRGIILALYSEGSTFMVSTNTGRHPRQVEMPYGSRDVILELTSFAKLWGY